MKTIQLSFSIHVTPLPKWLTKHVAWTQATDHQTDAAIFHGHPS
jgi:hypothetical protein